MQRVTLGAPRYRGEGSFLCQRSHSPLICSCSKDAKVDKRCIAAAGWRSRLSINVVGGMYWTALLSSYMYTTVANSVRGSLVKPKSIT